MSEIIEGSVKVIVDACFKAGYDKGYQQGRADAIEEMIVIIENNLIIDMDIDEHIANRNILIEKLKTLKGEKNDN